MNHGRAVAACILSCGLLASLSAIGCSESSIKSGSPPSDLPGNGAGMPPDGGGSFAAAGESTSGAASGAAGSAGALSSGVSGSAGHAEGSGAGASGSAGGLTSSGGGNVGGAAAAGSLGVPFVFGVPPTAAAHFKKGINLGNRLEAPQEGDWGGVIHTEDFAFIAKRGFDHVRIPIRFSGHASGAAPYTIDAAFFRRVDTVLDEATAAKLAVIIDLHAYDELALAVATQRERFLGLWGQIASHYQGRPETVAFELLNEPYGQLDTAWNSLVAAALPRIRVSNPQRLVIIDSVFWADPTRLSALVLPNDANLMASIHFYEPKLFTFQGMAWMGPPYGTTGVVFPGPPTTPIVPVQAAKDQAWANQWFMNYNTQPAATNPSGVATIAAQLALIQAYQKAQGRAVYNGEWGPQGGGALDSRVRLVSMVRQQCEQAGIGWAIWEDPVNMQLFDSSAGTWVDDLVDALLPR